MTASKRAFSYHAALLLFLLSGCSVFEKEASPASSYFLKYFGDDGFQTGVDVSYNSADQSFILLGTTQRLTDPDTSTRILLIKADRFGNVIWKAKPFGGAAGNEASDVEIASDGTIVVVGNEFVSSQHRSILVARFNQSGALVDSRILTQENYTDLDAKSITTLTDGGYLIAGSAGSAGKTGPLTRDALQLRLTSSLNPYMKGTWTNVLGNSDPQHPVNGVSTRIIQEGNVFFRFGYATDNHTQTHLEYQVVTLDRNGSNTQLVTYPTTSNDILGSAAVLRSSSNGNNYYLAGTSTNISNLASDIFLVALTQLQNSSGDTALQTLSRDSLGLSLARPVLPSTNPLQSVASLELSAKGGFFILTNESTTGNSNWLLIKAKNSLEIDPAWTTEKTYGGAGDDYCGAVKELPDGKIVMVGTMSLNGETKMTLIKVNSDGKFAY